MAALSGVMRSQWARYGSCALAGAVAISCTRSKAVQGVFQRIKGTHVKQERTENGKDLSQKNWERDPQFVSDLQRHIGELDPSGK